MRGHQSLLRRPKLAVGRCAVERPADVLIGLGDQRLVVQQVGQRHQPIAVIGRALPVVARAAQPAAVEADIGPDLVQVAGQPVGLDAAAGRAASRPA